MVPVLGGHGRRLSQGGLGSVSAAWCLSPALAHQPLGTELAQWHGEGDPRVLGRHLERVRAVNSSTSCQCSSKSAWQEREP